jgi:hypothetical protein
MSMGGGSGSEAGFSSDLRLATKRQWSRLGVATAVLGVALGGFILFLFNPGEHSFFPICFFHQATGLLCPGCGSLRAMHQLLHGHLATAFRFNELLVLALPCLAWFGARWGLNTFRGQPPRVAVSGRWLWTVLALIVAFSVWRNLPGHAWSAIPP